MTIDKDPLRPDNFVTENRILVAFQLFLMLATWPLWWGGSDFPAIPMVEVLRGVPVSVDRVLLGVFFAAALMYAVKGDRRSLPVLLCAGAMLCCLNQHRLQPWNWLFLVLLIPQISLPSHGRRIAQFTICTVYICAAASRFGPDMSGGMSRQLLTAALQLLRVPVPKESVVVVMCSLMTMAEFCTGLLLLTHRFRTAGVMLAVIGHTVLLVLLSPLGLNHHSGVLLWNAFFIVYVPTVFRQVNIDAGNTTRTARCCRRIVTLAVFVWPLSGLVGIADNWLSWQVYSPRPEVLRVYVSAESIGQLPSSLQPFVAEPAPLEVWHPVRIDLWSLSQTQSPIYPEDRFQLGIAAALGSQLTDPAGIRANLNAPAVPQWWDRNELRFADQRALDDAKEVFVINAEVR